MQHPRKIIFIINPKAGTKSKKDLRGYLEKRTAEKGIGFATMDSDADGSYDPLKQKIADDQITDVVVCGGDGTINAVAASLIGVDVNIGIIPFGSGNGLSRTAGISMEPSKALDTIFAGHTMQVDGFFINQEFSCMLSGLGFDAQVAHNFAKKKRRGLMTYAQQSLVEFFKAKPYPFEIETPQGTFSADAFFISIANSNQFGNNFTIAPKASLTDGLLDIVVVQKMGKLSLLWAVFKQIRGKYRLQRSGAVVTESKVVYFQTPILKIKNPQLALLHIDGDPKSTSAEFDIKIVRNAMRLLM